jgi:hypothetical protein
MKKRVLFLWAGLLVASCLAFAKAGESYQSATVMRVQKREAGPALVGSSPTDAPLHTDLYLYDVTLQVVCVTYVVRYESSFDQPPPMFVPDRHLDVRVEKHVLYASVPGGGDAKLSIVKRTSDS